MLVAVEHVPIATNPETRDSRLVDSTARYVRRNALRDLPRLRPVRAAARVHDRRGRLRRRGAGGLDARSCSTGSCNGDRTGHIQSLILGAVLALAAVQMFAPRGSSATRIAGQRVIAAADLRAGPAARARGRDRALPLRAGRPEPARPPAVARRSRDHRARPKRGRRLTHAVASGAGRRQRLRQVRDAEPGRAAAGGRVPARSSSELVERTGAREAHEVGCGEGELAIRLARRGPADARHRRLPAR